MQTKSHIVINHNAHIFYISLAIFHISIQIFFFLVSLEIPVAHQYLPKLFIFSEASLHMK
jgi:hypothetical protein